MHAFLQKSRQEAPAAGDACDGKAETIGSFRGGAVDASSPPAGMADRETTGSSQGGAVDASSAPVGMDKSETIGSSQGGVVNASLVPARRAKSDLSVARRER